MMILLKFLSVTGKNLWGGKKFIEPRELINAFVEKSYESYTNLRVVKDVTKEIEEILKPENK